MTKSFTYQARQGPSYKKVAARVESSALYTKNNEYDSLKKKGGGCSVMNFSPWECGAYHRIA